MKTINNVESNKNGLNSAKKVKKPWQTPTITLLSRGYVEGGAGAYVHESTARTALTGVTPGQGHPSRRVFHAGAPSDLAVQSANWTAAHS